MRPSDWLLVCMAGLVHGRAVVSNDGICGGDSGVTCMGSLFGNCCSKDGYCGATPEYCGAGCQLEFGICEKTENTPSQDGTCGGALGYTCSGSKFGDCCSQYGYCGSSGAYCGEKCRSGYGRCGEAQLKERDQVQGRTPASVTSSVAVPSSTSPSYSNPTPGQGGASCSANSPSKYATRADSCVRCEGQPGDDQFCGFDIHTNYYQHVPKTCRTVEYTLVITNKTIAPDGVPRIGLLVNGAMPGPVIEANWGDTVKVTAINQLQDNGTTIHFHGIRHHRRNQYDGVPSITQCPIPPGGEMTYTFVAESYGSSWYHSHFAIQTWEGVFGPVVIHGPTDADRQYDVDAGHIILQDWSHATVDSQFQLAQDATPGHNGGARVLDNGLINGKNTWGKEGSYNSTGERFSMTVAKGKSYLLRVINVSIQSTFKFHIDGHKFTVISTDFTPIVPYQTDILDINIGERYDVIVHADQEISEYWMRADNQDTCARIYQALDIKGIFRYEGAKGGSSPTTSALNYTTECTDENHSLHTPVLPFDVEAPDATYTGDITVESPNNVYRWYISGSTFNATMNDPVLLDIIDNGALPDENENLLIHAPTEGDWIYIVVETDIPLPHALHMHGHDFFILATGHGHYSPGVPLRLKNPSRRDTVLLPGAGFVVAAFQATNPGAWLMHCHVGWHSAMGFAAQIIEMFDQIAGTINDGGCAMKDTCKAWGAWVAARGGDGLPDAGV